MVETQGASKSHIWLVFKNTQRRERRGSRLRPRGLESHGEENVFNVVGKGLKTLDLMMTAVDQFIHLYKYTVSTIGDIF